MGEPTIHEQITSQLKSLETANHSGAGHVTVRAHGVTLRARLLSLDRLACELERVTVASPHLAQRSAAELSQRGDRLAERLAYLEESLVLLEADALAREMLMRSASPRHEGTSRRYYEVRLGTSGVTLVRYEQLPHRPRTETPMVLSRDLLVRLATDLLEHVR